MNGELELLPLLMMVSLAVGLFLGLPLAFILGGTAVIFGLIGWGVGGFYIMALGTFKLCTSYIMVAVPLFIFMATILERSGIATGLFTGLRYLFGPVRGGVGVAAIVVCTIFAACTGITGASIMSVGLIALPAMLAIGYRKDLAGGIVGAGGTLGILIPPSIMLVMMGDQAGISVGKLFAGAIIPGLVLSTLYIIYTLVFCGVRPEAGPPMSVEERATVPISKRLKITLVSAVPPLLLIFAVLGSIIFGIATPTEASGVGAFMAFVMMIGYRQFTKKKIIDSVRAAGRTSAMALLIATMATCFTSIFLGLGGGDLVRSVLYMFGEARWAVFSVMMIIVLILGMFIDWIGITYLVFPIFLPVATELGFDPLWFVIMIAVNLQASFLSPPFGYVLFYLKSISQDYLGGAMTMGDIYRGAIPFIILILIGIGIVCAFPQLALFLPSLIG